MKRSRWYNEDNYAFFPRTKEKARNLREESKENNKRTFALYANCIASNARSYMR